jgi:hypothetical protein
LIRKGGGKKMSKRTKIKWDAYLATAYAEGFCEGESATFEEQVEAWAYLIRTGQCWSLQGWFGRRAAELIEEGYIDKNGKINWGTIDQAVRE